MGELARHIANLPTWVDITLHRDNFDMHPPGEEPQKASPFTTTADLLELFDTNAEDARTALAETSDATMHCDWSLLSGGVKLFTIPKASVVRTFVISHIIHHRAQLGVYLRLNNIPLPITSIETVDT